MFTKAPVARSYKALCRMLNSYSIIRHRGIRIGDMFYTAQGTKERAAKKSNIVGGVWCPSFSQLMRLSKFMYPDVIFDGGWTLKTKLVNGKCVYKLTLEFPRGKASFHGPSLKVVSMMALLYFLRSYWVDEDKNSSKEKNPLKKPNRSVDLTSPN